MNLDSEIDHILICPLLCHLAMQGLAFLHIEEVLKRLKKEYGQGGEERRR